METQVENRTQLTKNFNKTQNKMERSKVENNNLSVGVELITPEKAANYLRFNKNNRSIKTNHVTFLSNQIKQNLFLENGEAIIFDKFGDLKDGQHRLKAISINNKSFFIPVVRGVESKCMATYDTGKNRSAADVLKLNGFQYYNAIATLVQSMHKYKFKKSKSSRGGMSGRSDNLTNQQVLTYVQENYEWLLDIVTKIDIIYKKMNPKVLSQSYIGLIVYLIGGEKPNKDVYSFVKHLTGVIKLESSAPLYLYTKLYNSKINKEPLNNYWILGMSIKAWNFYSDGNPAINHFKFSVEQELPKVLNSIIK
jgi:hypothetical protein